jgi:hypothetical protein
MGCTPISVQFDLASPDQLRKITLALSRSCMPDDTADWQIHFKLESRFNPTAEFFTLAEVLVPVPEKDHAAAEDMTKDGVCPEQQAQAWVTAGVVEQYSNMGGTDDPAVGSAVIQILRAGR